MIGRPLAGERPCRPVAAVAVDEQEAAEALAVEGVEQLAKQRGVGLQPQRRAAGIDSRERWRQAVRQHREYRHAERLGGLDRDTLGEDVVGFQREVGVLLR